MDQNNYTTSFTVDQSPEQVFSAVCDVKSWWSGEISGTSDTLGAEFIYKYKEFHKTTQKVTEYVPGKKLVWHVTEGTLNFLNNKSEWVGTDIIFEIETIEGKTKLTFTHVGIKPTCECYGACSDGWTKFINGNLKQFIITKQVQPNPFE